MKPALRLLPKSTTKVICFRRPYRPSLRLLPQGAIRQQGSASIPDDVIVYRPDCQPDHQPAI